MDSTVTLSSSELVAQYVLECKGQGQFLPYSDYEIIKEWVTCSTDIDDLLLILDEILPRFFDPSKEKVPHRSLRGARKVVLKKLKEAALRKPGVNDV